MQSHIMTVSKVTEWQHPDVLGNIVSTLNSKKILVSGLKLSFWYPFSDDIFQTARSNFHCLLVGDSIGVHLNCMCRIWISSFRLLLSAYWGSTLIEGTGKVMYVYIHFFVVGSSANGYLSQVDLGYYLYSSVNKHMNAAVSLIFWFHFLWTYICWRDSCIIW